MYANLVSTVSPTYAREILTPEFGMGLQDDLAARAAQGNLLGILNGVDYDDWDPRWDRWLTRHYGVYELEAKAALKKEFLARLKLRHGRGIMLLGLVSRFTAQKGLDLLFDALPTLLAQRDVCFVALGSGEERYEQFFVQLQRQFPKRVVFHRGYSDEMAHWIEAASDAFIMPSMYEPCGLNQMYSLRYGTVPIVRRTGGLADSVQLFDPRAGTGTGIVFNDYNSEAMSWALNTAVDLYREPATWRKIVTNAMAQDFSWERQGKLYVETYQKLAAP
jgi:starch synthase